MDWQIAFNILLSGAACLGGWVLGRITKSFDRLDADVRGLPDKYVTKADYRQDLQEIKNGLQRILDKLDGKADK